jgi:UDP-glucose 4-epimerase
MKMNILVTGGAGYIGSHFVKKAIESGHETIVFDNLSRGHIEAVHKYAKFEQIDLLNLKELTEALLKYKIDAVVHFAAFAYVGESVEHPSLYYENNVIGTLNLLKAIQLRDIKKFVFSSTCSLYGNPLRVPISEEESEKPINPYARTKLFIEKILKDYDSAYGLKYFSLRYFNAAGANPSGEIGESHIPETHLIPLVLQTALGNREKILIFGDNYDTMDGTCIRDYIHVDDLAEAHLLALEYLNANELSQFVNLGVGRGYSVKKIIEIAEEITKTKIKTEIAPRRIGDPAILVADNTKAKKLLNWTPKYDIYQIIETAYKWHKNQKY